MTNTGHEAAIEAAAKSRWTPGMWAQMSEGRQMQLVRETRAILEAYEAALGGEAEGQSVGDLQAVIAPVLVRYYAREAQYNAIVGLQGELAAVKSERDEWKAKAKHRAQRFNELVEEQRSGQHPEPRQAEGERITHGRHCICSACAREDWSNMALVCGMHGRACPNRYAPLGAPGDLVPHEPRQDQPALDAFDAPAELAAFRTYCQTHAVTETPVSEIKIGQTIWANRGWLTVCTIREDTKHEPHRVVFRNADLSLQHEYELDEVVLVRDQPVEQASGDPEPPECRAQQNSEKLSVDHPETGERQRPRGPGQNWAPVPVRPEFGGEQ